MGNTNTGSKVSLRLKGASIDDKAITTYLEDNARSDEDKIKYLESNKSEYSQLIYNLQNYQDNMDPDKIVLNKTGVKNNYNLYLIIKRVIETTDYKKFKIMFDIVNLFFRYYKNRAYNEYSLHRFSLEWEDSDTALTAYQHIITLISMLCTTDLIERKHNLSKISISKALDMKRTNFNDVARVNVSKYYQG